MTRFGLLLAMLCCATLCSAQLYKWVDKDGRVQYTDRPPPAGTKQEKTISIPPRAAAGGATDEKSASGPKTPAQMDAEFRKRAVERDEAQAKQAKEQEEEKNRASQCAASKSSLAQLESGQRISRVDEKGERTFMDDAERPKAIADARKVVESWCSPAKK